MFGWVIGTVAVVGMCAFARRRRHRHFAYYGGFGGHGPWDAHVHGRHGRGLWDEEPPFGWQGPGRMRRSLQRGMLRGLFMRLDTTPGQEKALVSLLAQARERLQSVKGDLGGTRRELAALLGRDVLDKEALEALIARQRDTLDGLAKEIVQTLTSVHEVLDGEQRHELGELLSDGSLGHRMRSRRGCY